MATETLHCYGCGENFTREKKRGTKPLRCIRCKTGTPEPRRRGPGKKVGPQYGLALKVTNYRLGLELARSAIRLGKYDEALGHIDGALK